MSEMYAQNIVQTYTTLLKLRYFHGTRKIVLPFFLKYKIWITYVHAT